MDPADPPRYDEKDGGATPPPPLKSRASASSSSSLAGAGNPSGLLRVVSGKTSGYISPRNVAYIMEETPTHHARIVGLHSYPELSNARIIGGGGGGPSPGIAALHAQHFPTFALLPSTLYADERGDLKDARLSAALGPGMRMMLRVPGKVPANVAWRRVLVNPAAVVGVFESEAMPGTTTLVVECHQGGESGTAVVRVGVTLEVEEVMAIFAKAAGSGGS